MNVSTLLKAGAILLPKAKLPSDVLSDNVVSRQWMHPALEDPIVRLPTQNMLRGIDLEMDLLGFQEATDLGVVGKQRRQKLGFPGWALVHDPDHARFALDVVKELKKATRKIKSKPGTAKEMIDKIAAGLSSSVPNFLPSFYEEAARAFLVFENYSYASQYFEKARNAERVYALEVDPELREQTFVDFALARALSLKSLTNFGLEMIEKGTPEEGFGSYFRIAVRRTLGGLPPSATMAKDLKKLAKAAGLDPIEQERNFLHELLGASALKKASAGFWKAYKKSLVALGKERPSARSQMLDLFPGVDSETWLEILDSCGALTALYDSSVDQDSKSSHTTADWFGLLFKKTNGANKNIMGLLERCVPRLKEDGLPIPFPSGWSNINQDVVEFGLSVGLTFTLPEDPRFIDVDDLASNAIEDEAQFRDWVYISKDETYRAMAKRSVEAGSSYYMEKWVGLIDARPALREIVGEWLDEKIGEPSEVGALISSYKKLTMFDDYDKSLWALYPEQTAKLVATDLAIPLQNSLQIGVWDELHWPLYTEILETFGKPKKVKKIECFPYITFFDSVKFCVFGAQGIVLEGELPSHKEFKISDVIYSQGTALLVFEKGWRETKGQWFGTTKLFTLEDSVGDREHAIYLDDGRLMTEGYRIITPGDQSFPYNYEKNCRVVSDGENYWRIGRYGHGAYKRINPITGELLEGAQPEFVAVDENEERWRRANMRVVPHASPTAPIYTKDGIWALRWAREDYGDYIYEDNCGNKYRGSEVDLLVRLPGDDSPRTVKRSYSNFGIGRDSVIGATSHKGFRKGGYPNIVNLFMVYFEARDEKGSQALRNISLETCSALLEAAKEGKKEIAKQMGTLLPEITDENLKKGVVGYIKMAHKHRKLLKGLTKKIEENEEAGGYVSYEKDPASIVGALSGLIDIDDRDSGHVILAQLADITTYFTRDEATDGDGGQRPDGSVLWEPLIGHSAAAAFRYAMLKSVKGTDEETLTSLKTFLYAMADSPFVGENLSDKIRYFEVEKSYKDKDEEKEIVPPWRNKVSRDVMITTYQGNEIFSWANWYAPYVGMEFARSGKFSDLKPNTLRKIGTGWGTRQELDTFFALVEEKGALPFLETLPGFMEKTGLSEPEASLAISDWGASRIAKKKMNVGTFQWASQMRHLQEKNALEFFSELLLSGPAEELWDPVKLEERLAHTWLQGAKVVSPLDPEFVMLFTKQTDGNVNTLREITDVSLSTDLNQDYEWEWNDGYCEKSESGFNGASHFLEAVYFTMHFGKVGSGVYEGVGSVLEKLRERMSHPEYLFELATFWDEEKAAKFTSMIKGKPKNIASDNEATVRGGKGVYYSQASWSTDFFANWAAIKDNHPAVEKLLVESGSSAVADVKFIFGPSVDAIISRVSKSPVPEGEFEANPIHSVPAIVEKVAKKYKISTDAAVLYLQIATLPFPTDANIRLWNGWKKKQHDTAIADLSKTDLVVVAKRARSSRSVFIPGPWEPKSWAKPIEGWKMRHLGLEGEGFGWAFHAGLKVPPHLLFEKVWDRIESGDAPGFEEAPKTAKR